MRINQLCPIESALTSHFLPEYGIRAEIGISQRNELLAASMRVIWAVDTTAGQDIRRTDFPEISSGIIIKIPAEIQIQKISCSTG